MVSGKPIGLVRTVTMGRRTNNATGTVPVRIYPRVGLRVGSVINFEYGSATGTGNGPVL